MGSSLFHNTRIGFCCTRTGWPRSGGASRNLIRQLIQITWRPISVESTCRCPRAASPGLPSPRTDRANATRQQTSTVSPAAVPDVPLTRSGRGSDGAMDPRPQPVRRSCAEHLKDTLHKIRQVVRFATRHKMTVDNDRSVLPDRSGVDQVVFDTRRARDTHTLIDTGRD